MAKSLHYVLFLFALAAILKPMVEAKECNREIGACTPDCNEVCASRYSYDGQGGCQNDKCLCIFTCGTEKRCNVGGLGLCSNQCNDQCCAANCAAKVPGGTRIEAFCNNSLDTGLALCQCSYDCS